jgi:hypothetical protein
LRQQTAPSPRACVRKFPHSRRHRQEKCGDSKSYTSVLCTLVPIYRQRNFGTVQKCIRT